MARLNIQPTPHDARLMEALLHGPHEGMTTAALRDRIGVQPRVLRFRLARMCRLGLVTPEPWRPSLGINLWRVTDRAMAETFVASVRRFAREAFYRRTQED